MSKKNNRRQAAQRKAKRKKMTILAICTALVGVFIIAAVVYGVTRPNTRVFAAPGNLSVTLYENGQFAARLAHGISLSGTFTEDVQGTESVIMFTYGGTTVSTHIIDDVLLLPGPWIAGCAHGHASELTLRR